MMKRGLSTPDSAHTAVTPYADRLMPLRALVRDRGLDAAVVYGDASCGGDIAYLTHAMLYWADAALVVPVDGPHVLVKTLGPRTDTWFRATAFVDEFSSGSVLAPLLARQLTERGYRSVGLVGRSEFPAGVIDALETNGVRVLDLGAAVAGLRAVPDETALADLGAAAGLGRAAMTAAAACIGAGRAEHVRAEAEFVMRTGGAWDATARVIPTGGATLLIDVRCQVRDGWFAAQRTLSPDGPPLDLPAFAEAVRAIAPGATESRLRAGLPAAAAGEQYELVLRPVAQIETSVASAGTDPAEWRAEAGSVAHLLIRRWAGDTLVAGHGDTIMITDSGAELLAPDEHDRPGELAS